MSRVYDRIPRDLIQVAERLTAERPELAPERLALARERVLARVCGARGRAAPTKRLWRPRLVLTGMLVLGIMLSTTGVGLAISGLAGSGSAGKAQYGNPGKPSPKPPKAPKPHGNPAENGSSGGVQGNRVSGGGGQRGAGETGQTEASEVNAAGQTQATTGNSGLPFTGLAAIPLILAGCALLITGIGLRRRSA